ncbi:MAG: hypothetical protein JSV97_10675 [candidate division WOR-3 bacterium]|nr:MAG: hypothetical protein JSV97_10675 [candidate division WOR-3 bacterium]
MRKPRIFLVVGLCLFLSVACTTREEAEQNGNDYKSVTVGGITLQWKADTLGFLNVKVSAPTTGWVAAGFDPTAGMRDANIIIGYVSGDEVFVRDDYGTTQNAHESDSAGGGENNISEQSGTEIGGTTEISFKIPLDSGDARDRPLVVGTTYSIILAYGQDDSFDSYHGTTRAATSIEL